LKSDQTAAIDADEKVLQLSEQLSSAEETSSVEAPAVLEAEYRSRVHHRRLVYKTVFKGRHFSLKMNTR